MNLGCQEAMDGRSAELLSHHVTSMAALPESLRRLEHPPTIFPPLGKRHLRVASVAAYEDAEYRRFLAVWRAQGHRLAYVQHGGNYGQIATACATAVVEFSQHAFFTWGWDSYTARGLGKGDGPRWLPLPYPQLAAMKDAWRGGSGHVCAVSVSPRRTGRARRQ